MKIIAQITILVLLLGNGIAQNNFLSNQNQHDSQLKTQEDTYVQPEGENIPQPDDQENELPVNENYEQINQEQEGDDELLLQLKDLEQNYQLQIQQLNDEFQGKIPQEILIKIDQDYQNQVDFLMQQQQKEQLEQEQEQEEINSNLEHEHYLGHLDYEFMQKINQLNDEYNGNIPEEILLQLEQEHYELLLAHSQYLYQQQNGDGTILEQDQINREQEQEEISQIQEDRQFDEELLLINKDFEAKIISLEQEYQQQGKKQIPEDILIEIEQEHQTLIYELVERREQQLKKNTL